jgi:hypothetical protein
VSPLALFLFSVFLMFAVFHQISGEWHWNPAAGTNGKTLAQGRAETERTLATLQAQARADAKPARRHYRDRRQDRSQKTALDILQNMDPAPL